MVLHAGVMGEARFVVHGLSVSGGRLVTMAAVDQAGAVVSRQRGQGRRSYHGRSVLAGAGVGIDAQQCAVS
ncbi:hypothetical protein [Actinacidiphila glaucinigra]|uniref:hypothetical protein n=1 Tax=Actinacidiphila glaucinigra TaxID=235986 RepID=UPI0035D8EF18